VIGVFLLRGHKAPSGTQNPPAVATTGPDSSAPQGGSRALAKGSVVQRTMPEVTSYASATIRGTVMVTVRAAVNASGEVTSATLKSAGPSRYFADRALIAARGWKFKPAEKNRLPVESEWTLRFRFRQGGTDATAVEDTP
jgi:TonB family protein